MHAPHKSLKQIFFFGGGGGGGGGGGSSSMKKCNQDFDQALIKKGGDLHSIHTVVS